ISLSSEEKASEEESTDGDLLAYDDAFNQRRFLDSSVIDDTISERNNMFSTTMVVSQDIKESTSSLNVEKSQAINDNNILPWPYMSPFK
ncbi:hypothetical protein HAX54_027206, partial [Datura stramonium]|nr:hypothetical protein [Datura stramonium]